MAIKYHLTKRVSHFWKRFRSLIYLYVIFLGLWIYIKYNSDTVSELIETKWKLGNGFFTSWFVSFSEDMFFFGTAFLSLIISTKLLRNESYDVRVSSLANGMNINKDVEFFLKKEIEKLLSYNRNFKLVIQILKIDPDKKNIFIHVDIESQIVNMCEDEKIPAHIGFSVIPGLPVNGEYGFVYHAAIRADFSKKGRKINHELPDPEYLIPEGHVLDLNNISGKNFLGTMSYHIPQNGFAKLKFCYGIWTPINGDLSQNIDWFFNTFSGYTENVQVFLENKLDGIDIFYDFKYKDRRYQGLDIQEVLIKNQLIQAKSKHSVISGLTFIKSDTFEVFFFTQKKD